MLQVGLDLIFSFSLLRAPNSYTHTNAFGMFILFKLGAPGYTRKQAETVMRNTWQVSSWFTKHSSFTWAWGTPPPLPGTETIQFSTAQRFWYKYVCDCVYDSMKRETISKVDIPSCIWTVCEEPGNILWGDDERTSDEGALPEWETLTKLYLGLHSKEQVASKHCKMFFHSLGSIPSHWVFFALN